MDKNLRFLDQTKSTRLDLRTGKKREFIPLIESYTNSSRSVSSPKILGWRKPNPYRSVITKSSPGDGPYREFYMTRPNENDLRASGTGIISPWFGDFTYDFSTYEKLSMKNATAIGALRKVGHRKASFGIMAAELTQTTAMIAKRATSIYRAYKLARKGKFRDAADSMLDSLSGKDRKRFIQSRGYKRSRNYASDVGSAGFSSWLEIQFGWLQLLEDAVNAHNVFKSIDDLRKLPRVSGYSSRIVRHAKTHTNSQSFYTGSKFPSHRLPTHYNCSIEYIVKCRADYAIGNLDHFMADSFGLNNPLEIAWDLVPYSFVLDWFLPIGDSLAALNSTTGLTKMGDSVTEFLVERRDYRAYPNVPSNFDRTWYIPNSSGSMIRYSHTRSLTPLGFLAVLPIIRLPSSLWHAITSVALINQRR